MLWSVFSCVYSYMFSCEVVNLFLIPLAGCIVFFPLSSHDGTRERVTPDENCLRGRKQFSPPVCVLLCPAQPSSRGAMRLFSAVWRCPQLPRLQAAREAWERLALHPPNWRDTLRKSSLSTEVSMNISQSHSELPTSLEPSGKRRVTYLEDKWRVKIWKEMEERIKKMWFTHTYIHSGILLSHENEIMPFAAT